MQAYTRTEVAGVFNFWVEIDGLLVAGFAEVSGLEAETEVEEFREGGVNDFVHQFPKTTTYPSLILRRGMATANDLYDWYADVVAGTVSRKSGSIIMQNHAGEEVCRWNFFESYPVRWMGPELNANSSETAIESVELVHNGLKAVFTQD